MLAPKYIYRDWFPADKTTAKQPRGIPGTFRCLLLDRLEDVEHLADVPVLGLEQVGEPGNGEDLVRKEGEDGDQLLLDVDEAGGNLLVHNKPPHLSFLPL